MIKLLIIADDFTGALDTGVQFASHGAMTSVALDSLYDFQKVSPKIQVLVLDLETRHLCPEAAYRVVFQTVKRAMAAGVSYIYKKTDSALRGNIGAELSAVMNAAETDRLPFVPAFPKIKRTTCNGIHFIDGVPVAESVFGRDPFEPVVASDIRSIIAQQVETKTVLRTPGGDKDLPGIQIFDAATDEDLKTIGWQLGRKGSRLSAGCAGFAEVLANILSLHGETPEMPALKAPLFVACGSINPVTQEQLDVAERAGFFRFRLTPLQKLTLQWPTSKECEAAVKTWFAAAQSLNGCILDTGDPQGSNITRYIAREQGLSMDQVRVRISTVLGNLMKNLLDAGLDGTLMCTGGDTLLALIEAVGVSELIPVCELDTGVVLTHFTYGGKEHYIISKSGGFGTPDLLCRLAEMIGTGKQPKEDALCL